MIDEIKVFYAPGDIVKLRHESIENRPTMLVKEKVEKSFKDREAWCCCEKCNWRDRKDCENLIEVYKFSYDSRW